MPTSGAHRVRSRQLRVPSERVVVAASSVPKTLGGAMTYSTRQLSQWRRTVERLGPVDSGDGPLSGLHAFHQLQHQGLQ